MKKGKKIIMGIGSGIIASGVAGLALAGRKYGFGPFRFLFKGFEDEVRAIEQKYDSHTRKNEIVFYGASNFRLWKEMENDLSEYQVQNHGFGGSTDKLLVQYADRLLYPYEPLIVFFQTGSNDYVELPGTDEDKIVTCMEFKKKMFATFHEKLPDARFVIMSGLLLPGRSQYARLTQQINNQLRELCAQCDYLTFVDASDMTYDGTEYREDLFVFDKIHLNHEGQLIWCDKYIRPTLEKLISGSDMHSLQKGQ